MPIVDQAPSLTEVGARKLMSGGNTFREARHACERRYSAADDATRITRLVELGCCHPTPNVVERSFVLMGEPLAEGPASAGSGISGAEISVPSIAGASELRVGQVLTIGTLVLDAGEIREFARRWDPQPFHLGEATAAASAFGGLVASGYHVLAACIGLQVRSGVFSRCNVGRQGVDRLEWRRPVRPGAHHVLELEIRFISPEPDGGRAWVGVGYVLRDQEGEAALDATILHLLRW